MSIICVIHHSYFFTDLYKNTIDCLPLYLNEYREVLIKVEIKAKKVLSNNKWLL